jgi:hypothetical protein
VSVEQDDETSDNDTMGGSYDPLVLIRLRANRVIKCWHELTSTTHETAFAKTARAISKLEDAIEDYDAHMVGQVVDAMTPYQVRAYLEMMGVNTEELQYRSAKLLKKIKTQNWGHDEIMKKYLSEGGTPT